jgi:hypothetical protein
MTTPSYAQDLIQGALTAMGGANALTQVKTLVVKGTVRYWEPEQSMVAGGEMRHTADATFEMTGDLTSHAIRVDWVKNFLYPSQRTFQFSGIVTPEAGYVIGIDSNGRNKQNRELNPPGHAMSGLRFTATQRELWRASPALLLEMRNHPDKVGTSPAITIGSVSYPALTYQSGLYAFIVMFDPQTHLRGQHSEKGWYRATQVRWWPWRYGQLCTACGAAWQLTASYASTVTLQLTGLLPRLNNA